MFELLKEIEKKRNKGWDPGASGATGASPHEPWPADQFNLGALLVHRGASGPKHTRRTRSAPPLYQAAAPANGGDAPNAPDAPGGKAEIIKWPHPGKPLSRSRQWGFLTMCPFTRTTLERATALWQAPLSDEDWTDIKAGKYLFQNKEMVLRDYLIQWADENPKNMRDLEW